MIANNHANACFNITGNECYVFYLFIRNNQVLVTFETIIQTDIFLLSEVYEQNKLEQFQGLT